MKYTVLLLLYLKLIIPGLKPDKYSLILKKTNNTLKSRKT